MKKLIAILIVALAVQGAAQAQIGGLLKKAKNAVQKEAAKAVEKKIDEVTSKTAEKVTPKGENAGSGAAPQNEERNKGDLNPVYTRVKPSSEYTNIILNDVKPKKSEWNANSPADVLLSNLSYIIRDQVRILNSGDFEAIAQSYMTYNSNDWTKIRDILYTKMEQNGDMKSKLDFATARVAVNELKFDQTKLLFPGLPHLDVNAFNNNYPMTKRQFYDKMEYFVMMAKSEKSDRLRQLDINEAIILRNQAGREDFLSDEDVEATDPQWISTENDLKAMGAKMVSFENLAKAASMEKELNRELARENNTKNIPKAVVKDAQTEALVMKLAKERFGTTRTPVKVILTQKDWRYNTNAFGVKLGRWKKATVIVRMPDKTYRMHTCNLGQTANGSSFNPPTLSVDSFGDNQAGYEINWKE